MDNFFSAILIFIVGTVFGWIYAHGQVASECQKLNSFYVGDKVYNCEIRK